MHFSWPGYPLSIAFLLAFSVMPASAARAGIETVVTRLEKRVVEKSPDIGEAQANLRQKGAQLHTAWARWLPRVELQLSQSRSVDYSFLTNGAITLPPGFPSFTPEAVNLSGWALRASVPLYRRSVYLQVEQSANEKAAAARQVDVLLAELDWRMRQVLGNYLLQTYKLATLSNSIEMAKANQREAKLRFGLGQRTRIDLLRAEANLLSLDSKRLAYQQEKIADWNQVREFSGLSQEEMEALDLDRSLGSEAAIARAIDELGHADKVLAAIAPYLGGGESAPDAQRALFARRLAEASPELLSIEADARVSESRAESYMAMEWPELAFAGSLYKQERSWGAAFRPGETSFSIGATLTIPLFLGGSLFSTGRERAEARTAARLKQEKESLHLRNEVESEWLQLGALQRSLTSAEAAAAQNEQLVKLSVKSYELGKATMLELLSAQNDLLDAKNGLARAKIDLAVLARRFAANLGVSVL